LNIIPKEKNMPRVKTIELFDGKKYTISTLPMSKTFALRKMMMKNSKKQNPNSKELEELEAKLNAGTMSTDELARYDELSDSDVNVEDAMTVIRESLASRHPEFKFTGNESEDKAISNKLQNLIDFFDMKSIMEFALTGMWPENETISDGPKA